jgi:hypothetical protein
MYVRVLSMMAFILFICRISSETHELIYNEDFVYYDECRISVSPRNYLRPVRAYAQVQKPCNGTLLWTYPNLQLTLTIVNLENDSFTLCFERKALDENLIRSIKTFDINNNQMNAMKELDSHGVRLLCTKSDGNRVSTIIDAQPLYAGVYLRYAMFNERHPWTSGPYPGWERSEKYLYGPIELIPIKQKKMQRTRKIAH